MVCMWSDDVKNDVWVCCVVVFVCVRCGVELYVYVNGCVCEDILLEFVVVWGFECECECVFVSDCDFFVCFEIFKFVYVCVDDVVVL